MTTSTITIESELKRRMDLVNSEDFRAICAEQMKNAGMSAEEWNNNKAVICLMLANEVCRIENKQN